MSTKIKAAALAVTCLMSLTAQAQKSYFVDGFHGGVYGHYPIATYTQYMSDQLRQHPSWRIGLEIEPETWDTVKARTPEAYLEFKRMTSGHQMEYTNPTYAQPYLYNIEGESIIRQFVYGMRKLHDHFPDMLIATYSAEEPCFTSCLPQVLSQLGFRYAALKCPDTCWGGYTAPFGGELVNFIGPDGTSMLAVPRYACEELEENSVWQTTAWNNSPRYLRACREYGIKHPVGMCFQDAGWTRGPWLGPNPHSEYVRWTDYIDTIADRSTATDYRFSQEDVKPGLMWGSQVLSTIARQVRHSETTLIAAEGIAAMHHVLDGTAYPTPQLDEAWRQLLLAQHHDSWIVPYNGLNNKGTWADNIALWTTAADNIATDAIKTATRATADGATAIRVYNSTATPRTEIATCTLPSTNTMDGMRLTAPDGSATEHFVNGTTLYFRATVPAYGFATYRMEKGKGKTAKATRDIKISKGHCVIKNSAVRLDLDLRRGGAIVSLRTPGSKFDYAATADATVTRPDGTVAGNRSVFTGELYGYFSDDHRFRSSTETEATAEILTDNSMVKRVCIKGHIASVPFTQTFTLHDGSPRIDINLDIDWKENVHIGDHRHREKGDKSVSYYDTRYMLSYMIPTGMKEASLDKDAPFDVCRSLLDNTYYNRWDSIKHNVVVNWLDVNAFGRSKAVAADADGNTFNHSLALLSDRTTSYSFDQSGLLRLTLQYSGHGLWNRDYRISRPLHQHFALIPHKGQWAEASIADKSQQWNTPLTAVMTNDGTTATPSATSHTTATTATASLLSLPEGSGYQLSSAAIDNDGNLVVRLFNASGDALGKTVTLGIAAKSVEETDLLGRTLTAVDAMTASGATTFTVSMPRFGIKTFRIKTK